MSEMDESGNLVSEDWRARVNEVDDSAPNFSSKKIYVANNDGQELEVSLFGSSEDVEAFEYSLHENKLAFYVHEGDVASEVDAEGDSESEEFVDRVSPLTALKIVIEPINIDPPYTLEIVMDPEIPKKIEFEDIGKYEFPHEYVCKNASWAQATLTRHKGKLRLNVASLPPKEVNAYASKKTITYKPGSPRWITIAVDGLDAPTNEYTLAYRYFKEY